MERADASSCPPQIRGPLAPRRARPVTARALSVLVITKRSVDQRVALDTAGAIELKVEPLAVTALATAPRARDAQLFDYCWVDVICPSPFCPWRAD